MQVINQLLTGGLSKNILCSRRLEPLQLVNKELPIFCCCASAHDDKLTVLDVGSAGAQGHSRNALLWSSIFGKWIPPQFNSEEEPLDAGCNSNVRIQSFMWMEAIEVELIHKYTFPHYNCILGMWMTSPKGGPVYAESLCFFCLKSLLKIIFLQVWDSAHHKMFDNV